MAKTNSQDTPSVEVSRETTRGSLVCVGELAIGWSEVTALHCGTSAVQDMIPVKGGHGSSFDALEYGWEGITKSTRITCRPA